MNSKLKELLSKDYITDVYGKIIYFVMVDGDLNSKLEAEKAIRKAVGEEMLELVEANTDHDGSARSISVAKLRQKIKEWSEETTK